MIESKFRVYYNLVRWKFPFKNVVIIDNKIQVSPWGLKQLTAFFLASLQESSEALNQMQFVGASPHRTQFLHNTIYQHLDEPTPLRSAQP